MPSLSLLLSILLLPSHATRWTSLISTHSLLSLRPTNQDQLFITHDGTFAAVFDGHGGSAVSRYLRQNLYANFQATRSVSNAAALQSAFESVDEEVRSVLHWSYQGSTACAVVICREEGVILSANVGDSRAILSRGGVAVELTRDHKPNDEGERKRIERVGGRVEWCGERHQDGTPVEGGGVYRINGNLALSRSIGDRCERPCVSSEVDIVQHPLAGTESFVLLGTDGLFDVMTSQEVVSFVHCRLAETMVEERMNLRRDIARIVAEEAVRRGTCDNVTVVVVWINNKPCH